MRIIVIFSVGKIRIEFALFKFTLVIPMFDKLQALLMTAYDLLLSMVRGS